MTQIRLCTLFYFRDISVKPLGPYCYVSDIDYQCKPICDF